MVLILTYWNVNSEFVGNTHGQKTVLILTYWNVNRYRNAGKLRDSVVLILTYWNVNSLFSICHSSDLQSINLNILECKCIEISH